jgi:hypothetical protein
MKHYSSTAFNKYGITNCESAYLKSELGNGASTIGFELGLTTNQTDAAINSWACLLKAASVGMVIYSNSEEYVIANLSPLTLFQRI